MVDETNGNNIEILGARVHNLRNIDVTIPRYQLTVITGLSGSGKSSLAFDTICAEGQRRYIETFSSYARNFLGNIERPDVDKIAGLSPVIAIEQKTTSKNPRSTVGTTTEIYDFLRLLFARAGEAYSYISGEKMVKYSEEQILSLILEIYEGKQTYILAPLVKGRKGHYKELFEQLQKKGFLNVRIDGKMCEITHGMRLDRYKVHDVELVVDKLQIRSCDAQRLKKSLSLAMTQGNGIVMLLERESNQPRFFGRHLMCPSSGISYAEPAPHNFSFNTPKGACPACKGIGQVEQIDIEKIIPDRKNSIAQGAIIPIGKQKNSLIFWQLTAICDKYHTSLKVPIEQMPQEALDEILNGSPDNLHIKNESLGHSNYYTPYYGIVKYIEAEQSNSLSASEQKWANQFSKTIVCPECHGWRLNREALHFKIDGKNIAELAQMDIEELYAWCCTIETKLSQRQQAIAADILKEIRMRLQFLLDVGLGYLSLNRASGTLSGGESQRIRLSTQIGSQLVNVLYVLDEPSIGLHQRDNERLIASLKKLRDVGNTVIVVEHDREIMLQADHIVDIGPLAGRQGGNVVFEGKPEAMLRTDTLTAQYLNGKKQIKIPDTRRTGNGTNIVLRGARGNNLKNIDVTFPLGMLIGVTGVSGSGKSSLINGTLYPILSQQFYRSLQDPLAYDRLEGIEHLDKVIVVDQSPIGRTPRSNPATYTGIFADIRAIFVSLTEAKIRGYKAGRFSFNTAGGRCESCQGNGYKTIEMNFLPNVFVPCQVCQGKRYNRETLEVRFKGKSIADVLDMTFNQAVEFFEHIPTLVKKLKVIQEIGLGYIKLGQPSTTLSGGECQRIKLAAELSRKDTGRTLYILDEPTTGLHFEDIRVLLSVLNRLVEKGNTVIVIEHNLDVIKTVDYLIDMGPEGGANGGNVVFCGTPEDLCRYGKGFTAPFLKTELTR